VRSVKFFDGKRLIATEKRGSEGLFTTPWRTRKARAGRHVLRTVVTDRRGATASATGASACAASRRHRRLERDRAAVARALRGRGWDCVLVARGEERLRPLAEELGAEWELCDVGDRQSVERAATAIVERHRASRCSSTTPVFPAAAASCGPPRSGSRR